MEGSAHQEFSVEALPTKSVAFHPTLATITREFPVRVQPGAFAITINKIDHQVDPDSIRVESLGPAKVLDIQHANVLRYSSTCKPSSDRKVFDPIRDLENRKDTIFHPSEGLYAGCGIFKAYPGNDSRNRERQPMGYGGASAQDPHRGEYGPALYGGKDPSLLEEWIQKPAADKSVSDHFCQAVVHLEGQMTAPVSALSSGTLTGDEQNQAGKKVQSNEVLLQLIYAVSAKSELKLHDLNINTLFSTAKIRLSHTSPPGQAIPSLTPWDLAVILTKSGSSVPPSMPTLGISEPTFPSPGFPELEGFSLTFTADNLEEGLAPSMYHDFYPPDSKVPESISQGHGPSVSYELPGRRVIKSSSAPRRYEIAELDLQASFTHVLVPKRHAAAFLRAKIQNTSPVNIRSGEVNLTVDHTCFGKTNVPSCVRNESFELNLGVDRFVKVAHKEPGITLSKIDEFLELTITYFKASCKIKNTRDHVVNVLVLDQVPFNVDDHFDVETLTPETLGFPGDKVDLTEPGKPGTKTAELGRDGEHKLCFNWNLVLSGGAEDTIVTSE
ncbi:uncharacterized protein BO87DRAFT_396708 [Aspergillus neoniger CBS 115656]|uniref:DUF4140 domain-containing protein n=1 Tax=Aspergillus neoniger (strain CBS 115656) TaxID=1448310 RepID=A0A318ZE56_ASPNB|nr:hypothetical protein BO87DRAFT_396708 [Aspergillus neoniger CBS 115656]PYH34422.1 hypothetical protein BO87DRAFT_396708 [Aspergillus neoniger CBS 115656]